MKKLPILLLALCLTVSSACGAGGVPPLAVPAPGPAMADPPRPADPAGGAAGFAQIL